MTFARFVAAYLLGALSLAVLGVTCSRLSHADIPTGYDVMRIDFPAEHTSKTFAACTFYPNNLPTYIIWCDEVYSTTYRDPINIGQQVLLGTIDDGFEWFSDINGACRLHGIAYQGGYTSFNFSCYTDRIFMDDFESPDDPYCNN